MAKTKEPKKLVLVSEKVISLKNPSVVLGTRPEDFQHIVEICKVHSAGLSLGDAYEIVYKTPECQNLSAQQLFRYPKASS